MYDIDRIRSDFPILQREVNGRPLVYLDNGATSQTPSSVIQTLVDYYEVSNANVHRGVHSLSVEATEAYELARDKIAAFINAASREEVILTRGTTDAINLVAASWGRQNLSKGDEILITHMEHHSNIVPWQMVCRETGAILKVAPVTDDGRLDMDAFNELLTQRTRLVAFVHMSNVLGTINPARTIIDAAHAVGALVLVDGAQSVPHLPTDVQALDCDFLAFSGHKMLGPTGIGVLYGKRQILEAMDPYQGGGDMIRTVTFDGSTWNDLPYKFEAGTPNIADAIGLGAAIDYLTELGMDDIGAHESALTEYALGRLAEVESVRVYGPLDTTDRGGVISFNIDSIHPHDAGTVLDQQGVAVRAGHHCAQPLMDRYGLAATTRASFYLYNTREEVDLLIDAVREAERFFAKVQQPAR